MEANYEKVTNEIIAGLENYKGFVSDDNFFAFQDRISTMKKNIEDAKEEGRKLKIGIVGEVKAGKSSFLNALVFDGKDILPKASTPMTAALTKITYAEKPSAKIVFYSEKDWENVINLSSKYDEFFEMKYNEYIEKQKKNHKKNHKIITDIHIQKTKQELKPYLEKEIPQMYISCKELTELAEKSSVDVYGKLGGTEEISINELNEDLSNYIGAHGQYTAIVKHVELKMNNDMLKDVEIVDTPGLNDPIISRGEITKKFLRECDVAFLLSYTGQFLTQEDINFMCHTLPSEGIRNIFIVGSKFDSGILDDNKSKTIEEAERKSINIYNNQAKNNIDACIREAINSEVLVRIKESLPPSYVSSILYSCSQKRKNNQSYNAAEANVVKNLMRFQGFQDDWKKLLSLSGIDGIKKYKIMPVIEDKEKTIEEKNKNVVIDNKNILLKLLEDMNIEAIQNKENLQNYDKYELEEKLNRLHGKLNTIRISIKNIFESSAIEAERLINNIIPNIKLEISNYTDINVATHTHNEHRTVDTGLFGLKKEHYVDVITTYSANVSDVIDNMRNYINRSVLYINDEFEKLINVKKLEMQIKDCAIGAFDLKDDKFNEQDIIIPVRNVMNKITIPKMNINEEQYETMIIDAFSGAVVEGEEIQKLKRQENLVFNQIVRKLEENLKSYQRQIDEIMSEQAATFVDEIIRQASKNIEQLKTQIDNKEESIRRYNELCSAITQYKLLIQKMEM